MKLGRYIYQLLGLFQDVASLKTTRGGDLLRWEDLSEHDGHLKSLGGELVKAHELLGLWIEHDDVQALRDLVTLKRKVIDGLLGGFPSKAATLSERAQRMGMGKR